MSELGHYPTAGGGQPVPGSPGGFNPATRSEEFRQLLGFLDRCARHDRATILLEGEPGTGKTSLARYVHERSPRSDRVFHRVDLGALDDQLSGSDLFGHLPGSFTGASGRRHGHFLSAERGTLFLDEIGKASLATQRKLLHVIEYGELATLGADRPVRVDVRIIAATNIPLEELVERGLFLPDLLPRFGFFRLRVPPLRERRVDIPLLVEQTIASQARHFGYTGLDVPRVHPELMQALMAAPWLGNVRELASAIQLLLVLADSGPELTLDHCQGPLRHLAAMLTDADRARRAFEEAGSVAGAARKLGVARTTVYRRLGGSVPPSRKQA